VRITDKEGKMETRPDFRGHHGGIARFGFRVIGVGFGAPFLDGGHTGFYVSSDRSSREINAAVNLCMGGMRALFCMRPVCSPVLLAVLLRPVAVDTRRVNGWSITIGMFLSAYATFDPSERWGDASGLAVGREEVVDDVLDEDSLALLR